MNCPEFNPETRAILDHMGDENLAMLQESANRYADSVDPDVSIYVPTAIERAVEAHARKAAWNPPGGESSLDGPVPDLETIGYDNVADALVHVCAPRGREIAGKSGPNAPRKSVAGLLSGRLSLQGAVAIVKASERCGNVRPLPLVEN